MLGTIVSALVGVAVLPACQTVSSTPGADAKDAASPIGGQEASMTDREAEIVASMRWVENADPVADARAELISGGAVELDALAPRTLCFPGLSAEEYESIKNRVGYRVPAGAGDVIYGSTHRSLRRQLTAYADTFNRTVYEALTTE